MADEDDELVRRALLVRYAETLSNTNVLTATMILSPFENRWLNQYSNVLKPSLTDLRIGQITFLQSSGNGGERGLLASLRQKTRNLVRKSLNQNYTLVVTDEDWAWHFLHEMHTENVRSVGGQPKPWEHFEALRQHIPAYWRSVFVALSDDQPVAALLLLYFKQTVEYITPVIKHEYRSRQPLSFLIWHAMLRAIANGYCWWNWGGTWLSQKSLYHFKAGWGAKDYPYTYLVNTSAEFARTIRSNLANLQMLFSYYYLFPYHIL